VTDFLVVDRRQPADDAARPVPRAVEPRVELSAGEVRPVARDMFALFGQPLVVFFLLSMGHLRVSR
jgi:hypothetical protein